MVELRDVRPGERSRGEAEHEEEASGAGDVASCRKRQRLEPRHEQERRRPHQDEDPLLPVVHERQRDEGRELPPCPPVAPVEEIDPADERAKEGNVGQRSRREGEIADAERAFAEEQDEPDDLELRPGGVEAEPAGERVELDGHEGLPEGAVEIEKAPSLQRRDPEEQRVAPEVGELPSRGVVVVDDVDVEPVVDAPEMLPDVGGVLEVRTRHEEDQHERRPEEGLARTDRPAASPHEEDQQREVARVEGDEGALQSLDRSVDEPRAQVQREIGQEEAIPRREQPLGERAGYIRRHTDFVSV